MAFVATLARRAAAQAGEAGKEAVLKRGARRDPELYVRRSTPLVSSSELLLTSLDPPGHYVWCLRSRRILLRPQAYFRYLRSRRLCC